MSFLSSTKSHVNIETDPKINVDVGVKDSFNVFCCCRKRKKDSTHAIDKRVSNVAKEMKFDLTEPDH